ncbi:ATP-grasp fold amidoligase family protein [Escherichia coli]|uniref:ATP-grasp fold amidoligase family protein n=1 Tax=Escherichia coli TaxID=562 RepID=UPI0025735F00|nr:ATP-grasp fold amidoligase family protein [Escherichia coli]
MLRYNATFSRLSDKLAVRDYVANVIGDEYLTKIKWDGDYLTRAVFESISPPYIIKANHGSGTNLIVWDHDIDYEYIETKTKEWLKTDFSKINLEKHYKNIKPRLFIEELLMLDNGKIPSDYKVHCFNAAGKYFIQVDYDRFEEGGGKHTRNIYDESWNKLNLKIAHDNNKYVEKKPELLDEILSLSKKLSQKFNYVRVDWYLVNNKLYFSEMTFTHGAGTELFEPAYMDRIWGTYWGNEKG